MKSFNNTNKQSLIYTVNKNNKIPLNKYEF